MENIMTTHQNDETISNGYNKTELKTPKAQLSAVARYRKSEKGKAMKVRYYERQKAKRNALREAKKCEIDPWAGVNYD